MQSKTSISILNELLTKTTLNEISKSLSLAHGTIRRWIDNKKIPLQYNLDICKLGKTYDIVTNDDIHKLVTNDLSHKDKDQFFTPKETVAMCWSIFDGILQSFGEKSNDYLFIEPSAGDGAFSKFFDDIGLDYIALDIEPRHDKISCHDFLQWQPNISNKNIIVFGNPPFGLRGNLALRFINHSSTFADFVCFILPPLFESDGKGSPKSRVSENLHLCHSQKIDTTFYDPNKKDIKINVLFQVWSKNHKNEKFEKTKLKIKNDLLTVYSLSDGGTPSSTRNKKMLDKCDVYLPSTCFGAHNMRCYDSFQDLPEKRGYGVVFNQNKAENIAKSKNIIDWTKVAFLSTNSAYNLRTSLILEQFIANE